MIEGAPDKLVERIERLPAPNDDVDEWVCGWSGRRPTGAPPLLRLLVERAPPTCYPRILPTWSQDPEVRRFAPWRAVRTGIDEGQQWSLVPHALGVSARALVDALGAGEPQLPLLLHVAHELTVQLMDLGDLTYGLVVVEEGDELGVDAAGQPTIIPRPRRARIRPGTRPSTATLLVRPFDLRRVTFAFDGDVALDVVSDRVVPERVTVDENAADFIAEQQASHRRTWRVVADVAEALGAAAVARDEFIEPQMAGGAGVDNVLALLRAGRHLNHVIDVLGKDARIPEGRALLRDMLRTLFPEEHRRARDIEESWR